MEGEFINNQNNEVLPSGNRVIQGIEFNTAQRTREAYWMFAGHPGDSYFSAVEGSYTQLRVPAGDVRLIYEPQRPGQLRGTPWLTPVLVRAKLLDEYEDAERQRKRMASSVPIVVKPTNALGEASDNQGPSLFPTMTDAEGKTIEQVEPALIAYLRDSSGIEFPKLSDDPSFTPYKRSELQSIAAGARSTYELTSGDLSQTSFSSIQFGTLSYRGMHDALRATRVLPSLKWIWRSMIDVAISTGRLPHGTSFRVKAHYPPWQPIDPEKAANANKTMLRTGETSLYEVVTARGKDFEAHMAEIAMSNKLLDKYGLVFDSDPRRTDLRGVNQQLAAEAKGDATSPVSEKGEAATDDARVADSPPEL